MKARIYQLSYANRNKMMSTRQRLILIILSGVLAAGAVWAGISDPLLRCGALFECPPPKVVGTVQDDRGQSVSGVVVRVQASNHVVTSDAQGNFSLGHVPENGPVMVTAYAPGYYIAGTTAWPNQVGLVLKLQSLPAVDNSHYQWLSAAKCAECHAAATPKDVTLPSDEWRLDVHAQAATNPRFLSMYNGTDVYGRQSPLTAFVNKRDYGRMPLQPDLSQPYYGPGYKLDSPESTGNCAACHLPAAAVNNPYGTDPNVITDVDREGVTCDFCHKIWAVKLDPSTGLPSANMPGVLSFEFRRPPDDHQLFIGPFDDVAPGEDTFSPLQNQSEFCAPCHFGVFWGTPVYNSFGEWRTSPYGDPASGLFQTCQDCHMPHPDAGHFARFEAGGLERDPEAIFSHRMPGASDQNLLQNSAKLSVTAERSEDLIQVEVEITNSGTGHHLPTDSPLRQVILVVKATDQRGQSLPLREGPTLPGWAGDFTGLPGVYFAKILEQRWTGTAPTSAYWTPTQLVEDTRLPALATNTSSYTFVARSEGGKITIEAQLIFRRAFYELMQQKGWDTPDILMESETVFVP